MVSQSRGLQGIVLACIILSVISASVIDAASQDGGNEVAKLKKLYHSSLQQLSEQGKELSALRANAKENEGRLESAIQEAHEKAEELARFQDEAKENEERLRNSMNDIIDQGAADLAEMRSEMSKLQKEARAAEHRRRALEENTAARQRMEATIADLESKLSQEGKKLSKQGRAQEKMAASLESATSEVQRLTQELAAAERLEDEQTQKVGEVVTELEDSKKESNGTLKEILRLRASEQELKAQNDAKAEQLDRVQSEAKENELELQRSIEEIKEQAAADIAAMKEDLARLDNSKGMEKLKGLYLKSLNDLRDARREVNRLQEDTKKNEHLQSAFLKLQESEQGLQAQNHATAEQLVRVQNEAKENEARLQRLIQETKDQAAADIAAVKNEASNVQAQLDRASIAAEHRRTALEENTAKRQEMEVTIAYLESELRRHGRTQAKQRRVQEETASHLEGANSEVQRLNQALMESEQFGQEQKQKVEEVMAALEDSKKRSDGRLKAILKLRESEKELRAQSNAYENEAKELKLANADLQMVQDENKSLQARLANAEKKVQDLNVLVDAQSYSADESNAMLVEEVKSAQQQLREQEFLVTLLSRRLEEQQVAALVNGDAMDRELEIVKSKLNQCLEKAKTLHSEEEMNALREALSQCDQEREVATSGLKLAQDENMSLKNRLEDAAEKVENLNVLIDAQSRSTDESNAILVEEVKSAQQQLREQTVLVNLLTKRLEEQEVASLVYGEAMNKELQVVRSKLNESLEKAQTLHSEEEMNTLREALSNAEQERDEHKSRDDLLEAQAPNGEDPENKDGIESLRKENETLKQSLDEQKDLVAQLQSAENPENKSRVSQLDQEIAQLKKSLAHQNDVLQNNQDLKEQVTKHLSSISDLEEEAKKPRHLDNVIRGLALASLVGNGIMLYERNTDTVNAQDTTNNVESVEPKNSKNTGIVVGVVIAVVFVVGGAAFLLIRRRRNNSEETWW